MITLKKDMIYYNLHQITYYHILLHLLHKRERNSKIYSQSINGEIKDIRIYNYLKRESGFS